MWKYVHKSVSFLPMLLKLLFLTSLVMTSHSDDCNENRKTNASDIAVLYDLYTETSIKTLSTFKGGDRKWSFDASGQALTNPCCVDDDETWKGLTCDCSSGDCKVSKIVYANPNNDAKKITSTQLPDTVGLLDKLAVLNFRGNSFSGTIPELLGSLTALTELDLSKNNFQGMLGLCDIVSRAGATSAGQVDVAMGDQGPGPGLCYLQCWNSVPSNLDFTASGVNQCADPTSAPSPRPSPQPTAAPTSRPSAAPTSSPSTPTQTPTADPTSVPTLIPSSRPSMIPTAWPTMNLMEPLVKETVLDRVSADSSYNDTAAQGRQGAEIGGRERLLQQQVGDIFYHSEVLTNLGVQPIFLSAEIYGVRLTENFAFTFLVNGVPSGETCRMAGCYPQFVECFVNAEVTGHVSTAHGGSALIEIKSSVIPPLEDALCGISSESEIIAFAKYSLSHVPIPTIAPSFAPTQPADIISSVADLDISLEGSISVVLGTGVIFGMMGMVVLLNVRAKSKRIFPFGRIVTFFGWSIAGANIVSEIAAMRVMFRYRVWVWTAILMLISRLGNIVPGCFVLFYIYGPARQRSRFDLLRLMDEKHWMSQDKVYFYIGLLSTFVSISLVIYLPWINTPFVSGSNGYPRVLVFKLVQSYNIVHSALKIVAQGSFLSGQGKKIREDIFSYMNLGFSFVVLTLSMMEYFVKYGTLLRLRSRVKQGNGYVLDEDDLRNSLAEGTVKLHRLSGGQLDLVNVSVQRKSALVQAQAQAQAEGKGEGAENGDGDGDNGADGKKDEAYSEVKISDLTPRQIKELLMAIQRERTLLAKEREAFNSKVERFELTTGGAFDELGIDEDHFPDSLPVNAQRRQEDRGSIGFSLSLFGGGKKSKKGGAGGKGSFLSSFYYSNDEESGPTEFTPNPMMCQAPPPLPHVGAHRVMDSIPESPPPPAPRASEKKKAEAVDHHNKL